MSNRVGVVIPARNRHEFIPLCVASIQAQTIKPHQIILVDDGSNPPIADSFSWPDVEIVRTDVGNGSSGAAARTFGAKLLKDCDYVLSIDSDDFVEPRYIEKLLAAINTSPRHGVAYPELWHFGAVTDHTKGHVNAGGLIRADVLRQVGYYPVTTGWDELVLSQHIDMLGFTRVFCDAAYYYRRHEDSISGPYLREQRPYIETVDLCADFVSLINLSGKGFHVPYLSMSHMAKPIDPDKKIALVNRSFTSFTSDYVVIYDREERMTEDVFNRLLNALTPETDCLCLGDLSEPWVWDGSVDAPPFTPIPAGQYERKVDGFRVKCCILAKEVYKRFRFRSNEELFERSFFQQVQQDEFNIEARWPQCQRVEAETALPSGLQKLSINKSQWKSSRS